jgi:putative transposase
VPGGTVFLTVVTGEREPLFSDPVNVERLRDALREVHAEWPFEITAAVVLPDHMHFLWRLPPGDDAYSKRVGKMKVEFTTRFGDAERARSASQIKHRESGVWQRRFWEHTIHDDDDFQNHLDYIHYNPVRHRHVTCPHAWPYSTFAKWVESGDYPADWGCSCGERVVQIPSHDHIATAAGE